MTQPHDDIRQRRETLQISPAPHPRHDVVVTHRTHLGNTALRLRYVPDRDILSPDSLNVYLKMIEAGPQVSLEEKAQTILEDINDQVIPSWLEVTMRLTDGEAEHDVRIEDRQPHWQDRGLLDRLEP